MESVDKATRLLLPYLTHCSVRRMMPWALMSFMVIGSLIKELVPLAATYLSNKRNVLNVYFVKFAWAWTFSLLLPFISLTNYNVLQNILPVLVRLFSLLVGTIIWYTGTRTFLFIQDFTGGCYKSSSLAVVLQELSSELQCLQAGGIWQQFDISGHSFLLSYCVLMILEEMAVMPSVKFFRGSRLHTMVNSLFFALACLTFIWLFMLLTTALYFHNFWDKFFGTFFGLSAWYGTYGFWYMSPFSPGLPPQRTLYFPKPNRRL
ncbi:fat storage-inducing transmembrane protein 2 [Protobothrops mucrosquamatus]|uniref:fat storage-inducing transmembrane protein 2 n=1 Tax=Protobothrops mucrosquamatus TaxID=103944 RepID=UPI00077586DB|nr:fat storage-inducing transmembrane protein 2 [Protobothrops mucrosquamatus]